MIGVIALLGLLVLTVVPSAFVTPSGGQRLRVSSRTESVDSLTQRSQVPFSSGVEGDVATPSYGSGVAAPIFLGCVAIALGAFKGHRDRAQRAASSGRKASLVTRCATNKKVSCVGIVGCSGAVGQEMLKCLESQHFPTDKVRLFAKRAAGTAVDTVFGKIVVEEFSVEAARECDIVLMAVSGGFSEEFSPRISGGPKNTTVIDNSSAFRMNENVPLVIPEINGGENSCALLVANPNCTTAIGAMALWPLHQKFKLKKVLMSTYQAASGAGAEGMAELEGGLKSYATTGTVPEPEFFAHQLPFNVIPHIDAFQPNGYTKEEMKVTWELEKIFSLDEDVKISCTAVRVPTLRAHSESIVIETELPITPEAAREVLEAAPGVVVKDDPASLSYPMPLNATGKHDVEVGRIRRSIVFGDHGIEFFLSGDQLLRGAALNAVLIAAQTVNGRS
jgi:aspartate-semialdehyde dehydrogenase